MNYKALITIIFSVSASAFGQGLANSPYSSFGVGDVAGRSFAAYQGMGSAGVAASNNLGLYSNTLNPAMLAYNRFTNFEVGIGGNYRRLKQGNSSLNNISGNLNYLNLTVPIGKRSTLAFGAQPYSTVDYKSVKTEIVKNADTTKVNYIKTGSGGINMFNVNYGIKVFKNLYLGAGADFYFGNIYNTTSSEIIDGTGYRLDFTDRTSVKGNSLRAGAGYKQKLNKKWYLNLGGVYEVGSNLKASQILTRQALAASSALSYQPITKLDTLSSLSGGKVVLPSTYRMGITLEKPMKLLFSVDYYLTQWSSYRNIGSSVATFSDTKGVAVGFEYTPNYNAISFLKKSSYRLGFNQNTTPYKINGEQLTDRSLSLGLMLPTGRSVSYTSLALIAGQRSSASSTLTDNYLRMTLGFSLGDIWFRKVRID